MDTKLKKYGNLKVKRIIAFLLTSVCFFTAGFSFCVQIRKSIYYCGKNGYYSTVSFRNNMNYCESLVLSNGELLSCETKADLAKTSYFRSMESNRQEKAEQLRSYCNYLDNLENFKVYVAEDNKNKYRYTYQENGFTYYFDYEGGFIDADEFYDYYILSEIPSTAKAAEASTKSDDKKAESNTVKEDLSVPETEPTDNSDKSQTVETTALELTAFAYGTENKIDRIRDCLHFIYHNVYQYVYHGDGCEEYHLNYGEATTDTLVEIYLKNTDEHYYDIEYDNYLTEKLNKISPSFNYAVFYSSTGKVFSNCGVKNDDSIEVIKEKLGGDYLEYIEDGKYNASVETDICDWLNMNAAINEEPLLTNIINDSIEKMYFSCSTHQNQDLFSIGQSCFDSNSKIRSGNLNPAIIGIISMIAGLLCSAYIITTAGKTEDGAVKIIFTDKVPLLINAVVFLGVMTLCAVGVGVIHFYELKYAMMIMNSDFPVKAALFLSSKTNIICAVFITLFCLIGIAFIDSIVRNVRNKTFIKHTLTATVIKLFKYVLKGIELVYRKTVKSFVGTVKEFLIRDYAGGPGTATKIIVIAAIGAVTLINSILTAFFGSHDIPFIIPFISTVLIDLFILWMCICFDRLAKGINQIKLGNFNVDINKKYMPPFMKSTADSICSIRDGLQNAVNDAIKQQATKTELITNVTHDLKTPLTSIITYVDLLGKTEDPDEQKEYLSVLDEKSQKLKKLIDDLVQASKASGGTLDVKAAKLNLCEFAAQIAGEYSDELKESGIELIVKTESTPVFVFADPNITERIFENLLVNIKKYTLKGSRAYIEVSKEDNCGVVKFKNTSASIIDCEPDKLKERFFRGDTSRTGEGNGLGLAITDSLCNAQGGKFVIETDADLFKTYVYLPIIP